MKMAVIPVTLLLSGLFIASTCAQDSTVAFDLVRQGEFPAGLWGRGLKPAHLVKNQPDYLAVLDTSGFSAWRLVDTTWTEAAQVSFVQNSANRIDGRQITWTVGDLDNDGADEIVTWDSTSIIGFHFQGNSFIRRDYPFPLTVQQGVIGDIDNDGRNELVVFAFSEAMRQYVNGTKLGKILDLCVMRLDSTSHLTLVYADGGTNGYLDRDVVPPDILHFIAPFTSSSVNQLVISLAQSDVSPTYYHVFSWDHEALWRLEKFHLINGRKVDELPWMNLRKDAQKRMRGEIQQPPEPEYPFSVGGLIPIILEGKPATIDNEFDKGVFKPMALQPEGDHFKLRPIIFSDSNPWAGSAMWMDPDGHGKGLLGSTYRPYKSGDRPEYMNWRYSFYRLHSRE